MTPGAVRRIIAVVTSGGDSPGSIGPGTLIADYRVIGVLGVGGSGTVYRATKADASGRDAVVAVKILNEEHSGNDGERQRFAREAEIVKRLAHPHVVGLLDYGFWRRGTDRSLDWASGEIPYLVFPFLEGRTLESRIAAEGALPWTLVGRFAEQALSALEMAHAMGIAHRDIKPANIFCCAGEGGEEVIQILDFGTAKIVGEKKAENNEVTRAGMLVGTPRYMAPEQARGEPLTPTADVYAFGLVMAEMLLGRPFVTGNTDFEIYVAQGSDKPHVLPDTILDSPFATVIARAIAKPIMVRYRLASQMLADVRAILQRFTQGEQKPLEGDMEATSFFGFEPEAIAPSESAQKLRNAFNAIANKAPAPKKAEAAPQPIATQAAQPVATAPAPVAPPPVAPAPAPQAPPQQAHSKAYPGPQSPHSQAYNAQQGYPQPYGAQQGYPQAYNAQQGYPLQYNAQQHPQQSHPQQSHPQQSHPQQAPQHHAQPQQHGYPQPYAQQASAQQAAPPGGFAPVAPQSVAVARAAPAPRGAGRIAGIIVAVLVVCGAAIGVYMALTRR